jgi:hypothetical protein
MIAHLIHLLGTHSRMNIKFFGAISGVFAAIATTAAIATPASAASLTPVNLELSLLVDVSDSISSQEYALQIGGYKQAFTNLSSKFGGGSFGSVAVNFIEWSGATQQRQSIPWTLLNSQASAIQFANTIGSLVRPYAGSTAPGSAINFAVPLFSTNEYDGNRWVIDVSGDGTQNAGASTSQARNAALAAGVDNINGLAISTGSSTFLKSWYEQNIQGGAGSFVLAANGFQDFGRAIEQKLGRELATPPAATVPTPPQLPTDPVLELPPLLEEPIPGFSPPAAEAVPEPTTMLGIALAGSGLAYFKRRKASV